MATPPTSPSAQAMTRACVLPWERIDVHTSTDPPEVGPCRNIIFDGVNAHDIVRVRQALRELRGELRSGNLDAVCRSCPDQPLVPVSELRARLDQLPHGDDDENQMLEALGAVAGDPLPTPPPELMFRVAHIADPHEFRLSGVVTHFDFAPHITRHDPGETPRLLDWGCGSGRLAIPALHYSPGLDYTGVDIDAEAIEWCRSNLPSGRFEVIDPAPPTGFADRAFTSVVGYSVVTHLSRSLQDAWVFELHRILDDRGIVIFTTLGETAAQRHGHGPELRRAGLLDDRLDPTFNGITPEGYYRTTFQTRAATEELWGALFEIVEYREAAIFGIQDLVVARKRPAT